VAPASSRCGKPRPRQMRREREGVTAAGPERRALSGLAPPASRAPAPLSAGDLCQPSGPDGEGQAGGQARNPRGEPFKTGTWWVLTDCHMQQSICNALVVIDRSPVPELQMVDTPNKGTRAAPTLDYHGWPWGAVPSLSPIGASSPSSWRCWSAWNSPSTTSTHSWT
jgi:hypothetical protein